MSHGKIFSFDFHQQTQGHLRQVILHPLICGCRLLRFLNQDDVKKQRLSLRNLAMGLPDRIAGAYLREIETLGTFSPDDDSVFPYPYLDKEPLVVESGFDRKRRLPYVVHKGRSFFGMKEPCSVTSYSPISATASSTRGISDLPYDPMDTPASRSIKRGIPVKGGDGVG